MSHARLAVGALLWSLGLPPAESIREELDVSELTVTIAAPIRKEPDPPPSAKSWTKAAVFVLDYDGCFDIVAMEGDGHSGFVDEVALTGPGSDQWFAEQWHKETLQGIPIRKQLVDKFTDFVKDTVKDVDKVIVFLGSGRQDAKTDNARARKNGSARKALQAWVQTKRQFSHPSWELKKDLLGDWAFDITAPRRLPKFTGKKKREEDGTVFADGTAWYDTSRNLIPTFNPKLPGDQMYLKRAILDLQLGIASKMADEVDAYFFDAEWQYLDFLEKEYEPPQQNVVLRVVWWDWKSYAFGKSDDGSTPSGGQAPPWWTGPKDGLNARLASHR